MKTYQNIFFCLLTLLYSGNARARILDMGSPSNPNFENLKLENTSLFRAKDGTFDIRLKTQDYYNQRNVLYLDFDQPLPHLLRDQAGNFRIQSANYIVSPKGFFGKRAALFNRRENKILVVSSEKLWPIQKELESFSIEMWVQPIFYYRKNILLRKTSLFSGHKRGFELSIEKGRLYFRTWGLFFDEAGAARNLHLQSRNLVARKKWSYLRIEYDEAKAELRMFVNGQEEDRLPTRNPRGAFFAKFGKLDLSPIEIAPNYSGFLDELRVATGKTKSFHSSRYPKLHIQEESLRSLQKSGWIHSAVLDTKSNHLRHAKLWAKAQSPKGTHINFWVRHSFRPFSAELAAEDLPWKKVALNHLVHLPAFRYLQWRAELKADPEGKRSPVLQELRLELDSHESLVPPANFRVVPELSTEGRICLEWQESPKPNIRKHGQYAIYIGLLPKEFFGFLELPSQSPLLKRISDSDYPLNKQEKNEKRFFPKRFQKKQAGKIRFFLTNQMIENYIYKQGRKLPLLSRDRIYYFAISVKRNKQESSLSKKISFYLDSFGEGSLE